MKFLPVLFSALALFLSACQHTNQHAGDFVQTTDFHTLQSYKVEKVELSGMEWPEAKGEIITEVTLAALAAQLEERGFPEGGTQADFIVRANWKKALRVKLHPRDSFRHVPEMSRYGKEWMRPQVLCSLTVELYDPIKDVVFWQAEMKDCLNILRVDEENVVAAIQVAMSALPQRIEMDPNLRTIE